MSRKGEESVELWFQGGPWDGRAIEFDTSGLRCGTDPRIWILDVVAAVAFGQCLVLAPHEVPEGRAVGFYVGEPNGTSPQWFMRWRKEERKA